MPVKTTWVKAAGEERIELQQSTVTSKNRHQYCLWLKQKLTEHLRLDIEFFFFKCCFFRFNKSRVLGDGYDGGLHNSKEMARVI